MLLLAYLLRSNLDWCEAQVNLKLVVEDETAAQLARENVNNLFDELRLGIQVKVIVDDERPFPQILRESSQQADLIFLGLPEPKVDFVPDYERLMSWTAELPTTVFVLSASEYSYEEVLTEDGKQ